MLGPRSGWTAFWISGALFLGAGTAQAGTFAEDGSYQFDPEAVQTYGFEDGVPEPIDEESDPLVDEESDSALVGDTVLTVSGGASADFLVDIPEEKVTVRASLWMRGGDGAAYFVVTHDDDELAAEEISTLYPTGRVTSDGWVELANEGLRIDGARSTAVIGLFNPAFGQPDAEVQLDAIEVVIDGTIAGEVNRECAGAYETHLCDPGQICLWSECHNVNGWVPPIPPNRDEVALYLENRIRYLFGPFINRTLDLPQALATLSTMQTASDPWAFWNGWAKAVRQLHDGHTSTTNLANFGQENPRPLNVCFVEGIADETLGTAPADPLYHEVLVSHVGPGMNLGLQPGDRLVSVDGMHPIAWARSLVEIYWPTRTASNHETFAEQAESMRSYLSRFADVIEVIKCGDAPGTCGQVVTVDISALPFEPFDPAEIVTCDNRPIRHLADSPANHAFSNGAYVGKINEALPTEEIYGVEWEALGSNSGLQSAVNTIKNSPATGVILDHRAGNGGTFAGPAIIWNWAVPQHPNSLYVQRQRAEDEQPSLAQGLSIFNAGGSEILFAGTNNPTTLPVALLITRDVSASDWLPLGMKDVAPNIRIFGPYETNGAFSTRYELSYWLGLSYLMASGDTFLPDGRTTNGEGVDPDEVVFPLQSDLIVGTDTVFEAALQWVRQEIGQ